MPNTPIPTFHGLRIKKGRHPPRPTGPATGTMSFITACPLGHLCMEEAKCPPASRTGGPSADPTEGDIPEKIPG